MEEKHTNCCLQQTSCCCHSDPGEVHRHGAHNCGTHSETEHHHDHDHHDHHDDHHHSHDACGCTCGCGCSHDHGEMDKDEIKKEGIRLAFAAALFAAAFIVPEGIVKTALFLSSCLVAGWDVLAQAGKNLLSFSLFDETFLMTVATVGAAAIGEFAEAAAVMLLFSLGELLEDIAVGRSRKNVKALVSLQADTAHRVTDNGVETVDPTLLAVGDLILVRPFERVPADGVVTEGDCHVDMAALTGESVPVHKTTGDEVLSGTLCGDSPLTVRVTTPYADSTVAKVIRLTEQANAHKAPQEKFISRFARVYTPVVCALAAAVAVIPPLLGAGAFRDWLYTALKFLVISCPCALVISVPLAYFAGMGCAAKQGILIKGSAHMDALRRADIAALDKTGTLTKGIFTVTQVIPANGFDEQTLVALAAAAEQFSTHPIALCISGYAKGIKLPAVCDVLEMGGKGIAATTQGTPLLVGSTSLLREQGVNLPETSPAGTVVLVALDGIYAGALVLGDEAKPDAAATVKQLHAMGVETVMLTGDSETAARHTADKLDIRRVHSGLLPTDKLAVVQSLQQEGHKVAFAGDGINDAPVITAADVGLSMGGLGSDAAIEASDIVIMTDEPKKLVTALRICRRTHAIVVQNIVFALGVKAGIMVLSFFNIPMWLAIVADVGVALAAVLNATRALQIKE